LKISLKTASHQKAAVKLSERLPKRVHSPSELAYTAQVTDYNDYYLLSLDVEGTLTITCQRCLQAFQYEYGNHTQLAVCANDAVAEKLMEQFECIVAKDDEVDLDEILTDELHLFAPEKHVNSADCNSEMNKWLS